MRRKLGFGWFLVLTLLTVAPVRAQDRGMADYLLGINSLSDGNLTEAVQSFDRAIEADDENASFHTARGVALYLLDRNEDSARAFGRALKLGKAPATELWNWANDTKLLNPVDDETMDEREKQRRRQNAARIANSQWGSRPPYESSEPYARPMIEAAMMYATPQPPAELAEYKKKLLDAGAAYARGQMSGRDLAPALATQAKSRYDQRKYAEALVLLERIRAKNPTDPQLLLYSAGCELALGNLQAARLHYTQVLRGSPRSVEAFLGRARAAAAMSSIARARRDLDIAGQIDTAATDRQRDEISAVIAQGEARLPKEPAPELLKAVKEAVAADEGVGEVVAKSERLMRAAIAARFDTEEAFTDERQRLEAAVRGDPKNPDKLAALAEFLVNPTMEQPVRIPGQSGTTRIALGAGDIPAADAAVDAALAIDPKHINAMTQKALAFAAKKQPNDAVACAKRAFAAGGSNLDLCRINLDFYTHQANLKSSEAYSLRQSKVSFETRGDTEYRITTYPSAADLARADQLDREAQQLRGIASAPLRAFVESNANTFLGFLATAELARWASQGAEAAAALEAALRLDPWNLDAHEFAVELYPKIGMMNKAIEHQDLLNNLVNRSAGRTLDKVWKLLAETRYRSARETLDSAEQIEPASAFTPAYRAAVAAADSKPDEAARHAKQAVCMEEARQRVGGRTLGVEKVDPLSPADVGLTLASRMIWGDALTAQQKPADAWEQYKRVALLARRVDPSLWDSPVQHTALPAAENAKSKGSTIRELAMDSQMKGAKSLLGAGRPEEAAAQLIAYIKTFNRNDMPPGTLDFGYEIYKALGRGRAAQVLPQNLISHYQQMDHMASNRAQLERGDQIQRDYETKVQEIFDKRTAIDREMRQTRDQQRIRELREQRRQLDLEYQRATRQMQQDQMQNNEANPQGTR